MISLGRIYNYKILVAKLVNVLVAVCFVGHKSILQWYLLKELPYLFRALLIIDSKISTHNLIYVVAVLLTLLHYLPAAVVATRTSVSSVGRNILTI
jgi:hypothetical protein